MIIRHIDQSQPSSSSSLLNTIHTLLLIIIIKCSIISIRAESNCTECNVDQHCPPDRPIRISPDIPCLEAKLLGNVCLHSSQCETIPNAACLATILNWMPMELVTVPTYRQWYIYSQITNVSDELSYLLNKVYGKCGCKHGYHAYNESRCHPTGADTGQQCTEMSDCLHSNSLCKSSINRCFCMDGYRYHSNKNECVPINGNNYRKFCVLSSDCQIYDPNSECNKSKCTCNGAFRYEPIRGRCESIEPCRTGNEWDPLNNRCKASRSILFNTFLLRVILFVLLNVVTYHIVRIVCCTSGRASIGSQVSIDTNENDRYEQSHSLLSLPPYESICNDVPSNETFPSADELPTYEEALRSSSDTGGNTLQMVVIGKDTQPIDHSAEV